MTSTPHDALVKATFSKIENARQELKYALSPELVKLIDFSTLKQEPGSFITEGISELRTDLLFSAKLAGEHALLYLLWEHKSKPERFLPVQLLGYAANVYRNFLANNPKAKHLPAIIPIVFHHGKRGWTCPRNLHSLLLPAHRNSPDVVPWVPNLEFMVDDIGPTTDQELLSRDVSVSLKLTLWALRDSRSDHFWTEFGSPWAQVMRDVLKTRRGRVTISLLCLYILSVRRDATLARLRKAAQQGGPAVERAVMNSAQKLIAQGRVEGIREGEIKGKREGKREGIREGEIKGLRKMLRRVLIRKFGTLTPAVDERLESASQPDLDRWSDRIFAARTLDEVFE